MIHKLQRKTSFRPGTDYRSTVLVMFDSTVFFDCSLHSGIWNDTYIIISPKVRAAMLEVYHVAAV